MKQRRPGGRASSWRGLFATPLMVLLLVAVVAPPTVAGSAGMSGRGLLQVSTQPLVDSAISVDGTVRNTGAIEGIEVDAGEHDVCFSAVRGFLPPPCQSVEVREGETTSVTGDFTPAGTVEVATSAGGAEPAIIIDGIERDRGSAVVPVSVGEHTVCAAEVAGFLTPDCETVNVEHHSVVELTLAFSPVQSPELSTSEPDETSETGPPAPTGQTLLSSDMVAMVASDTAWSPQGNVTIATDPSVAAVGTQSLRVKVDRSGRYRDSSRTARAGTPQFADGIRVDAGEDYLGFLRVRADDTTANARCEVRFYRSNGSIITTVGGELTATVGGEWVPLTCEASAPAGTHTAALRVFIDDVDYGAVFHVDDPWLGLAGEATAFTDESTGEEAASSPDETTSEPAAPAPDESTSEPAAPGSDPAETSDPSEYARSWQEAWNTRDYNTIRAWYRNNTGIAAAGLTDADLTPSGSISTSRDGQVIEGLLVKGSIQVKHDDVTIRNTKVTNDGSSRAINIGFGDMANVHTLTVEDVSLIGTGGCETSSAGCQHALEASYIANSAPPGAKGVQVRRLYVNGFGNGIRIGMKDVPERTEYMMVENIRTNPGSHNTGFMTGGGSGKSLYRSWIEGSTSAGLALYPDFGVPIKDFEARENLFDGGTYSINAGDGKIGSYPLRFYDNLFTKNYQYGPVAFYRSGDPGNEWKGNFHLDGTPAGTNR